MGTKDRPHREQKKKAKAKEAAKPHLESLLQTPPPTVEVIKPKRKPRWDEEPEAGGE